MLEPALAARIEALVGARLKGVRAVGGGHTPALRGRPVHLTRVQLVAKLGNQRIIEACSLGIDPALACPIPPISARYLGPVFLGIVHIQQQLVLCLVQNGPPGVHSPHNSLTAE